MPNAECRMRFGGLPAVALAKAGRWSRGCRPFLLRGSRVRAESRPRSSDMLNGGGMVSAAMTGIVIRTAEPSDAEGIADAHRDSITSLGPAFYSREDVNAWQDGLTGGVYVEAMIAGEVFFIATASIDGMPLVLGFASDYRIEGLTHGTSVYVRGMAARCGIGTILLRSAEAHAA